MFSESCDVSCHFSPKAMARVQLSMVTGIFSRLSMRLRNGISCHPKSGENAIKPFWLSISPPMEIPTPTIRSLGMFCFVKAALTRSSTWVRML